MVIHVHFGSEVQSAWIVTSATPIRLYYFILVAGTFVIFHLRNSGGRHICAVCDLLSRDFSRSFPCFELGRECRTSGFRGNQYEHHATGDVCCLPRLSCNRHCQDRGGAYLSGLNITNSIRRSVLKFCVMIEA